MIVLLEKNQFKIDNLFKRKIKPPNKDDIIQRLEYLFNAYEKIEGTKRIFNTYFRCPLKGDKESDGYKCKCIPLIKCKQNGLVFICEKKHENYFSVEELLKLILDGELFFKINKTNTFNINSKDETRNKYNNSNINKDSTIKNDVKIFRSYRSTIRNKFKKMYSSIKYKHKEFKKILKEYNTFTFNNDTLYQNYFKMLYNCFKYVYEKVNLIIYHFIIKRLNYEYLHIINGIQKSKYKAIIQQNISLAQKKFEYLKEKKKNNK